MTTTAKRSRILTFSVLGLFLAAFALTGCRTMEGAGKDIERAGEKIQDNSK